MVGGAAGGISVFGGFFDEINANENVVPLIDLQNDEKSVTHTPFVVCSSSNKLQKAKKTIDPAFFYTFMKEN